MMITLSDVSMKKVNTPRIFYRYSPQWSHLFPVTHFGMTENTQKLEFEYHVQIDPHFENEKYVR